MATATAGHSQEPLSPPPFEKPGYLESYIDPDFGSEVTRISGDPGAPFGKIDSVWNEVARHGYSKDPAWNSDQTLLLLRTHHGFPALLFLDGMTYEPVFGRNNIPGSEVRWHPQRPNHMVYVSNDTLGMWHVRDDKAEVLATFDDYSELHFGPWEGNLSRDGRRVALNGKRDSKQVAFCYDFQTGIKGDDITFDEGTAIDWVSISPSGKYLVANGQFGEDRGDQTQIFTRDGKKVGDLWRDYGRPSHYDLTIDSHGDEVAVGVSKSAPDEGRVIKRRLSDGKVTVLTPGGYAGHTSTRNIDRPDWAYVTYQYRGPDWLPYRDEVIAVNLDGSQTVQRIARLYTPETDYLSQAHAVPSPDGTRVLWAGTWEANSGRPVGAYVARLKLPLTE